MSPTKLAALIRYKTKTNSTTFTDADMLPLVNLFKDEISALIVERDPKMFLVPAAFDLVADQREYAFEDDQLGRMHKLELAFASGDAYEPSTYIKDYRGSETESEIVKRFSNAPGEFAHTIRRRSIFILSGTISAVTEGGMLHFYEYPADLANLTGSTGMEVDPTTTTFGFPRAFHELLARAVSIEYKGSQPKPIPLNKKELQYEVDLERALATLNPLDQGGEIIGEVPPEEDFYNSGHDL